METSEATISSPVLQLIADFSVLFIQGKTTSSSPSGSHGPLSLTCLVFWTSGKEVHQLPECTVPSRGRAHVHRFTLQSIIKWNLKVPVLPLLFPNLSPSWGNRVHFRVCFLSDFSFTCTQSHISHFKKKTRSSSGRLYAHNELSPGLGHGSVGKVFAV